MDALFHLWHIMDPIERCAALFIGVWFYLIPCLLAWGRHHHQRYAITAFNILLGWTVLGWIAAFCIALMQVRPTTSTETP